MTLQRLMLLVGAIALIVGLVFLFVPVNVTGPRGEVGCGNAVSSQTEAAEQKDASNPGNIPIIGGIVQEVAPETQFNYVAECNSALSTRRAWSIPLTVVGVIVIAAAFVVGGRASAR